MKYLPTDEERQRWQEIADTLLELAKREGFSPRDAAYGLVLASVDVYLDHVREPNKDDFMQVARMFYDGGVLYRTEPEGGQQPN